MTHVIYVNNTEAKPQNRKDYWHLWAGSAIQNNGFNVAVY